MDSKVWMKVLEKAAVITEAGQIAPHPDTILTIHVAGVEVSLKHGSEEIVIDPGDEIMTVTNKATGFVQFLPWNEVTKIEQRRTDDHRYRHGSF